MDLLILTAIASASAINSAMPGPCIALTVGRAAGSGFGAGLQVTLGVLLANLLLCLLSLSIIAGVMAISVHAFDVMKWIGVVLLLLLAIWMLRVLHTAGLANGSLPTVNLGNIIEGALAGFSISPFNLTFLLALLQFLDAQPIGIREGLLTIAAVLIGASFSQTGATLLGAFSRKLLGDASHWLERAGALALVSFAAAAVFVPF